MNLLITGAWSGAAGNIAAIERMGHAVCFLQEERDPIPCGYEWVEGIVGNGIFQHHPIERFSNLRFVQLTSAGLDRVPLDYIQQKGIALRNARGVYSIPMAEFAVAGVLQLYKQLQFFSDRQKQHKWEKHRGLLELKGKTVCIVGCGSVGTECAKRFAAFGCHVVGVSRTAENREAFEKVETMEHLDAELSQADIVVLSLPLTEQTRHMLNRERLARLKKGAVLVNIARGALVDTDALIDFLPDLGGAVLDVFEEEPLEENSPLWDMENVILTPHNSFVGDGNEERLRNIIFRNLEIG